MLSTYIISLIITGISKATPDPAIATAFNTIDTNAQNNCEWEDSNPMTNTAQFPFGNFVAVDSNFFQDAKRCGECYQIQCVGKKDAWSSCTCKAGYPAVTVMVVDYGHDINDISGFDAVFDIPISVANQIFQTGCLYDRSQMAISYQRVCCNGHPGNIKIYNNNGINPYWLSFVVAEVGGVGSIDYFYMREPGRSLWSECNRDTNGLGGNWVCDPWMNYASYKAEGETDGLGPFDNEPQYQTPISIKIVDDQGNALIANDLITSFIPKTEFDFGSNFAACTF